MFFACPEKFQKMTWAIFPCCRTHNGAFVVLGQSSISSVSHIVILSLHSCKVSGWWGVCVCVCGCVYTCAHLRMHVCMHVVCVCVCMCMQSTCMLVHKCVRMHAYMYTHVHICVSCCSSVRQAVNFFHCICNHVFCVCVFFTFQTFICAAASVF